MKYFNTSNPDSVNVRHDSDTIHTVVSRIRSGTYNMLDVFSIDEDTEPEYQHNYIIHMAIYRIPIPMMLMYERADGKRMCVGNRHIFKAIYEFFNDEFTITGTGDPNIDGKKFSEMIPRWRNRIEGATMEIQTFDYKTSLEDVKTFARMHTSLTKSI